MEGEVSATNKGGEALILENFKFRKAHTSKLGEIRWRCSIRGCTATVYTTTSNMTAIIRRANDHCHQKDERKIFRQLVTQAAKRKAIEDCSIKPAKVIRLGVQSVEGADSIITQGDINSIRKNCYYARRRITPPLPKSRKEVQLALNNLDTFTTRGENFLLVNDIVTNIIVLSCKTNLQFLCDVESVYMDGTFNYCTKFYTQMFTVHGLKNGHYIPLVFCLLPNKLTETYSNLFKILKSKCEEINLALQPRTVTVDFEKGIHNALAEVFPESKILGCRFHLGQAWWRKIQKLGLSVIYKNPDSLIGKWLKYPFGLTYLDPSDVGDCFALDFTEDMPENEGLRQFYDYLVENYIDEESIFPPSMWAENSTNFARTTNSCESFHSRFNSSFYSCHPDLYTFMNVLINDFQFQTYIKIQSVDESLRMKPKLVRKRDGIENLIAQLKNGSISRFHFVKCISHYCAINL